jgi:hypothetical protein
MMFGEKSLEQFRLLDAQNVGNYSYQLQTTTDPTTTHNLTPTEAFKGVLFLSNGGAVSLTLPTASSLEGAGISGLYPGMSWRLIVATNGTLTIAPPDATITLLGITTGAVGATRVMYFNRVSSTQYTVYLV